MDGNSTIGPLIQAAELAGLRDEHLIVDCRFRLDQPAAGERAWREGHIPGARYAHLERDLSGPPAAGAGRHPLPDPASLVALFSRWGIRAGCLVVAYDDSGGAMAARLWWLLRWMGHRQVALLDGGLQAWLAHGLPLSTTSPADSPAHFHGEAGQMPVVDAAQLADGLRDGSLVLLDARARSRFRGEEEPIDAVAGHVPGAINLPWQEQLAADGRFRAGGEIAAALEGIRRPGARLAAMCGSGVTACHLIFAMELAGLGGTSLYPASWSGWIAAPGHAVARGP